MPRTKPHAKIHVTMKHHIKTAALWADNDMLALYVRLLTLGIERFAARTGDTFTIHEREVAAVTGRKRRDYGELALTKLAASSPLCATKLGASWQITIPNFAKKQGFRTKNGTGKSAPEVLRAEVLSTEVDPPIAPPADSAAPLGADEPPEEPVSKTPRRAKSQKTAFPDDTAELVAGLEIWADSRPELGRLDLPECCEAVREWATAHGHRRKSWLATTQTQIRSGWARKLKRSGPTDTQREQITRQLKERDIDESPLDPDDPVFDLSYSPEKRRRNKPPNFERMCNELSRVGKRDADDSRD